MMFALIFGAYAGMVLTVGIVSLIGSISGFKVGFRRLFAYYFVRVCAFVFGLKVKKDAVKKLLHPPKEKYENIKSPRMRSSPSKQISRLSVNLSDIVPFGENNLDETQSVCH